MSAPPSATAFPRTSGVVRAALQLPAGRLTSRASLLAGVRAATATVVPIAAAWATGDTRLVWAALGGWLTTFADAGGAYRSRARAMGAFAVGGAVAASLGAFAGRAGWFAVPLVLLWATGGAMLRVYGDAATTVGNLLAIVFVASLGTPVFDGRTLVDGALARGAFIGGGSLAAAALALVVWPLRPWQPARRAIAECYDALAELARSLARVVADTPHERDAWHAVALREHLRIRTTIEVARATLGETRRSRTGASARGEQLVVLLEIADQEFEALIAVAESVEVAARAAGARRNGDVAVVDAAIVAAAAAALRSLGDALAALGTHIPLFGRWRTAPPAPRPAVDRAVVALWDAVEAAERRAGDAVDRVAPALQAAALLEHAATLADSAADTADALVSGSASAPSRTASPSAPRIDSGPDGAPRADGSGGAGLWAPLRANLTTDSLMLRHAARVGVVAAIATWIGLLLDIAHATWITTTALLVLQPHAGPTLRRSVERVTWTVLGGVVAALLAAFVHDRLAMAGIMFPLAVASIAVRAVHYGLFTFFLTPVFVLLAEPAMGDYQLAGVRALDTLAGGLLALGASRALWPSWERYRLPSELGAMIAALRTYFCAIEWQAFGTSRASPGDVAAARRATGLANNNVDAAVQRLVAEPPGALRDVETIMTLLTFARRASGALTLLAVSAAHRGPPSAEQAALARAIDAVLADVAEALPAQRAPAPLPSVVARYARPRGDGTADARAVRTTLELPAASVGLDRVARQVAIIHGAAARLFDTSQASAT